MCPMMIYANLGHSPVVFVVSSEQALTRTSPENHMYQRHWFLVRYNCKGSYTSRAGAYEEAGPKDTNVMQPTVLDCSTGCVGPLIQPKSKKNTNPHCRAMLTNSKGKGIQENN